MTSECHLTLVSHELNQGCHNLNQPDRSFLTMKLACPQAQRDPSVPSKREYPADNDTDIISATASYS